MPRASCQFRVGQESSPAVNPTTPKLPNIALSLVEPPILDVVVMCSRCCGHQPRLAPEAACERCCLTKYCSHESIAFASPAFGIVATWAGPRSSSNYDYLELRCQTVDHTFVETENTNFVGVFSRTTLKSRLQCSEQRPLRA